MVLITPSLMAFSQTFEQLYDADSTVDIGNNVLIREDSSYLIIGSSEKTTFQHFQLMTINISADGSHKMSTHLFQFGTSDCYTGNPGTAKILASGGHVIPISLQTNSVTGGLHRNSTCGLAKLTPNGDTVFVKTYNDTNINFTVGYDCTVMPDGGYILAGTLTTFADSAHVNLGLLIRTDSNGNKLWQRVYSKFSGIPVAMNSIDILDNSRIILGASCVYSMAVAGGILVTDRPWFIILDTSGNIIRDTLYNSTPYAGGYIHKDKMGGYFFLGAVNYSLDSDPGSLANYPSFLAHLDTNFNTTWVDTLKYSHYFGKRKPYNVKQLEDSSYVMPGIVFTDLTDPSNPQPSGWTGKIDKHGTLLWNKYHAGDSTGADEIADVAERADGSLIFCGDAWNDSLPVWHIDQDVWLISTDSNGCLTPGCDPDTTDLSTGVPEVALASANTIVIYPNPTTGTLTIQASDEGSFYLYNIMGQMTGHYTVRAGETFIALPPSLASGIYMGKYIPANGQDANEMRIILDR